MEITCLVMPQTETSGPINKFHPIMVGKTLGAEIAFIEELKATGQIEMTSPELCDFFLVFCPIESRVGTDISGAMQNIPGGKQVILVVMHHTMRPDDFAGDSRRHVTRPDIVLTVDCLFFEGRFLDCDRNKFAFRDIKKKIGGPSPQGPNTAGTDGDSTWDRRFFLGPMNKFHPITVGKTLGAEIAFIEKLKATGQIEVTSPEICDYLLVFCPIESRVGTDISGAMQNIPGGKQVILVVMHHTMRPDNFAGDSKRHVTRPDIVLTVDCLFFEGRFLDCDRNKIAFRDIKKKIGGPCPQIFVKTQDTQPQTEIISDKPGHVVTGPNSAGTVGDSTWDLGPMNKFHPITVGKTLGAEIAFIEKLKATGQIEMTSPELCDYFLVFCPIESRVGTDISGAMQNIPGGKQVILVVMHHTMRPDDFAGDSRRHVTRPDIVLTVDCLFFEGRFLDCDRNKFAFRDIKKKIGGPCPQIFVKTQDTQPQTEIISDKPGHVVTGPNSAGTVGDSTWDLGPMNKFHPITVGKTLGAEIAFIEKLKAFGQIEVTSPELCDYFLVFCPIESRVGTDISGAMQNIPGGKQVILVVMHHTMRPDDFAGDSRRHVTRPDIVLTVDCLFFEGRFLDCDRNKIAFRDIKKTVGGPRPQGPNTTGTDGNSILDQLCNLLPRPFQRLLRGDGTSQMKQEGTERRNKVKKENKTAIFNRKEHHRPRRF
ncbi:uncharacterized protein LOC115364333 isoform X2 [Myripristis murdjan]|uniref:uncharacterized protein LOC115364333 isoform X2 n=1 Tax=Myripristis murdjan TaxID=586833 RepID=UPI0011760716|nr:uncharacterized protein LOC115364333 isoform X2 [Myripristis murdjan]